MFAPISSFYWAFFFLSLFDYSSLWAAGKYVEIITLGQSNNLLFHLYFDFLFRFTEMWRNQFEPNFWSLSGKTILMLESSCICSWSAQWQRNSSLMAAKQAWTISLSTVCDNWHEVFMLCMIISKYHMYWGTFFSLLPSSFENL